jgi:hypothetical protein
MAQFGPVGHTSQNVFAGKLWILFEYLFHRHARREQLQDQGHSDPMLTDCRVCRSKRWDLQRSPSTVRCAPLPLTPHRALHSKPLYL